MKNFHQHYVYVYIFNDPSIMKICQPNMVKFYKSTKLFYSFVLGYKLKSPSIIIILIHNNVVHTHTLTGVCLWSLG